MKQPIRERFGMWLERFVWLRPVLLKYDGEAPAGGRYVNRVSRHLVLGPSRAEPTEQERKR